MSVSCENNSCAIGGPKQQPEISVSPETKGRESVSTDVAGAPPVSAVDVTLGGYNAARPVEHGSGRQT